MARPQFKNSNLKLESSINIGDKITVAFWFNMDDPALQEQLERYFALSGNNPSIQLQRKEDDRYVTVGGGKLFMNDDRLQELKNNAAGNPPAAPDQQPQESTAVNPNSTDFNYGENSGFPGAK